MTLTISTDNDFRSPGELEQLVRAVLKADPNDENRWLEWKSSLDLTTKEAQFTISKAVLGFANRPVQDALQFCKGTAYLVVGAEHDGRLLGVTPMDHADLGQKIKTYVGGAVRWNPTSVAVDGKSVLVVTVEAPRPGDDFHTLLKDYAKFPAGTIFVRHPGRTERASPDDVRLLQTRLLAGAHDPEMKDIGVDFELKSDAGVCRLDDSESAIKDWVAKHCQSVEERQVPTPQHLNVTIAGWDKYKPKFDDAMDLYLKDITEILPTRAYQKLIDDGTNDIQLIVENTSSQPLSAVQITLNAPAGAEVFGRLARGEVDLPETPRWPGPRTTTFVHQPLPPLPPLEEFDEVSFATRNGQTELIYSIGDLRPGERKMLKLLAILPPQDEGASSVDLRWVVTSMNRRGQVGGKIQIPINQQVTLDLSLAGLPTDTHFESYS
ncbi:AlbA family DNA-binding domain-containing protein [Rhodococcus qingshengii]|uniref:AlbA family DNA-binding domain-containing protein n=1 Tax=Rhodococcus qingshengii TaxID=334542 RepID=UPI00279EDEF7|nr:ATP-binding protein [Rhodococcus qingshengii]